MAFGERKTAAAAARHAIAIDETVMRRDALNVSAQQELLEAQALLARLADLRQKPPQREELR